MEFKYNDGGRKEAGKKGTAGDCVTRSIAIATNSPYDVTYKLLTLLKQKDYGKSAGTARNGMNKETYAPFLEKHGWKYIPLSKELLPFDRIVPTEGTFLVKCHRHLTCVIDGVINDTWNPSIGKRAGLYGIWIYKGE